MDPKLIRCAYRIQYLFQTPLYADVDVSSRRLSSYIMHLHPEASSREENPAPTTKDELVRDLKALSDGFIEELQRLWGREEARGEWDMEMLTWDETEGLEEGLKGLEIGGLESELGRGSEMFDMCDETLDGVARETFPDEKEKDTETANKRAAKPSHPSSPAIQSPTMLDHTCSQTRKDSWDYFDLSPRTPECSNHQRSQLLHHQVQEVNPDEVKRSEASYLLLWLDSPKSLWKSALKLRGGRERKSPAVGIERRERQMQLKKRFEARRLQK